MYNNEILLLTEKYKTDMFAFLRDIIRAKSFSGQEKAVVLRIKDEMEKVGFDKVIIDGMGNVLGYIGNGKRIIAMDAHIDTVEFGESDNWQFDPLEGYEDDYHIGGRGASDQKGGMASMVYAAKILKELNLLNDITLVIVGSVQEEDCDGLCWEYILNEDKLVPEMVLLTEPTDGCIHCGQRGRMEIKVSTVGVSCHGSCPERGDNAIYKMADIITDINNLNKSLEDDGLLGKGSVTISEIFSQSPSRCAVADSCWISLDRRMNTKETPESCIEQIKNLSSVQSVKATVEMYNYERPSYTGLIYPIDKYYPTWYIPENHQLCLMANECHQNLFGEKALIKPWVFSTNGVSIMGRHNIPCIGYGPGHENEAHAPNEKTFKNELVKACAMYVSIVDIYTKKIK